MKGTYKGESLVAAEVLLVIAQGVAGAAPAATSYHPVARAQIPSVSLQGRFGKSAGATSAVPLLASAAAGHCDCSWTYGRKLCGEDDASLCWAVCCASPPPAPVIHDCAACRQDPNGDLEHHHQCREQCAPWPPPPPPPPPFRLPRGTQDGLSQRTTEALAAATSAAAAAAKAAAAEARADARIHEAEAQEERLEARIHAEEHSMAEEERQSREQQQQALLTEKEDELRQEHAQARGEESGLWWLPLALLAGLAVLGMCAWTVVRALRPSGAQINAHLHQAMRHSYAPTGQLPWGHCMHAWGSPSLQPPAPGAHLGAGTMPRAASCGHAHGGASRGPPSLSWGSRGTHQPLPTADPSDVPSDFCFNAPRPGTGHGGGHGVGSLADDAVLGVSSPASWEARAHRLGILPQAQGGQALSPHDWGADAEV